MALEVQEGLEALVELVVLEAQVVLVEQEALEVLDLLVELEAQEGLEAPVELEVLEVKTFCLMLMNILILNINYKKALT